ncbi:MAG: glycoside hydrolase family 3 C-terminal domain-containing protein, partial [Pirellulales bacterium]|nr:glycoside hydrolase family 3 C-terminal domain-containing protein [Pirellulales bacterium]
MNASLKRVYDRSACLVAFVFLLAFLAPAHSAFSQNLKNVPYRDASLPVEKRVDDLLARMTLDEKIGQLHQMPRRALPKNDLSKPALDKLFGGISVGGMSVFDLTPEDLIRHVNAAQDYVKENTQLDIPLLIITETLHGLISPGTTIYPQTIAQGATWDPELIELMAAQIAREGRALGINQSLSPMVTMARDPRWGRVEECFSECPTLVSAMALAYVQGMQGRDYPAKRLADDKLLCMSKVLAAYEIPRAGINLAGSSLGERELRSIYLVPHERLVKEGHVASIMPSYHCIDGVPAHANRWILTDVIRGEWHFDGYIYADWGGVGRNHYFHKVAATWEEAARMAIMAGMDMEAPTGHCYVHLKKLVEDGRIPIEVINTSARRVLRAKFCAGLFDVPVNASPEDIKPNVQTPEHVATARKIAEESIVLLKNDNNLLPLDPAKIKKIALVGPNADQVQFGDYSAVKDNKYGVTVKEGLEAWRSKHPFQITYARGCHWVGSDRSGFDAAVAAARASDVAIVVVGDTSMCIGGGVAGGGDRAMNTLATVGEGYDRTSLTIPGVQEELVAAVQATGKPVVLVLINGRPFAIPRLKQTIPAIVEAFYPGQEGGHAIADVLFGKVNPSGRLPLGIPQSVGHVPCTYDYHPGDIGTYNKRGTP